MDRFAKLSALEKFRKPALEPDRVAHTSKSKKWSPETPRDFETSEVRRPVALIESGRARLVRFGVQAVSNLALSRRLAAGVATRFT